MKKRLIILICIFGLLVTGCSKGNTPSGKVEEFFGKYQTMDSEVLTQLDNVISNDSTMNDVQKKDYQALMEKQYQNLSYKIKNEDIKEDKATVLVEIEVFDYANSIIESRKYYNDHRDEFKSDDSFNKDLKDESNEIIGGSIDEISSFIDYKIKQLKTVTDKAKYEITFYLTKKDGNWEIDDISDDDRLKIHGLYEF